MAGTCHRTSAGWTFAFTGTVSDLKVASESADRNTSAAILGKTGRSIACHVLARTVPSTSQPLSVMRGTYRPEDVQPAVSGRKLGFMECKHRAEPAESRLRKSMRSDPG